MGDHDYKRDVLELANVNAARPCSHCPCDRQDTPWFDFSLTAKWISKTYQDGLDLKCMLLRMSCGLSILAVYPDWMHDKYLGTDKVNGESSWSLRLLELFFYMSRVFATRCVHDMLFMMPCVVTSMCVLRAPMKILRA